MVDEEAYLEVPEGYYLASPRREELSDKFEVFQRLVEDFPTSLGKETSKAERDTEGLSDTSLIYGEVDFLSIGEAFDVVKHKYGGLPDGGVFYDLGAGTGKGVLAAALLHPFEACKGIEILSGLHTVSLGMKDVYDAQFPVERLAKPHLFPTCPMVEFKLGSFLEVDWSDATFFFANSTCFEPDLMMQIAEKPFPIGNYAITLTKGLPSEKWEELSSFRRPMSWGEATIFIQRRVA